MWIEQPHNFGGTQFLKMLRFEKRSGRFGMLTCLNKLDMWECEALEEFPSVLSNLTALEQLNFSKCRVLKHVPEGFGASTCSKKVKMWECEALEVFPCGLSNLTTLEEPHFSNC